VSRASDIIKGLVAVKEKTSWSSASAQKLVDEIAALRGKYEEDRTINNLLWHFNYIVESVAKGDSEGVIEYANKLNNDFKRGIPNIE